MQGQSPDILTRTSAETDFAAKKNLLRTSLSLPAYTSKFKFIK